MCILFEICQKRPFQKCMGWGRGGIAIFQRSTTHWTVQDSQFPDEALLVPHNVLDCEAGHVSQAIIVVNILQSTVHRPCRCITKII